VKLRIVLDRLLSRGLAFKVPDRGAKPARDVVHLAKRGFSRDDKFPTAPCFALLVLTAVALPMGADAGLANRWSFNNSAGAAPGGVTIPDSIGAATAVVVGTGATFSGTALTLPGTTNGNQTPAAISAYVDLPNGLISSKPHLTLELWATPVAYRQFQRLFEFGRVNVAGDGLGAAGEITRLGTAAPGTTQASDSVTLTLSRNGGNLNQQRFEGKLNGVTNTADAAGLFRQVDTNLATAAGMEYHYVMTFEGGAGAFGAAGGRLRWFRNGALVSSTDVGFRLNQIEDVNNWLGRSLWSSDTMANVAFNEVRLYDAALTAGEIAASYAAGPNPAAPVAQPDTVTLHQGQKVLLNVLANDTGSKDPGTVEIVQAPAIGTAVPDSEGRILYTHPGDDAGSTSFTYRVSGLGGTSAPATVTVNLSDNLRIPTPALNVPGSPPQTALGLINALTGLTFNQPLALASPPGDNRRLFVCEKPGQIKVVPDTTAVTPSQSTFLNLAGLLTSRGETLAAGGEQGLLGLTFHPNYASNRFFYIFYSVRKTDGLTYERVSRFTAQTANPNAADSTSELVLIEQRDEADNHNGGDLGFGPDGYLYISLGDEGGQNSQYSNDQRIDKDFFAAIARIDVDKKTGSLAPNAHASVPRDSGVARYAVPPDNPWVGATSFNGLAVNSANVRTEFYAVGFRNPWRFSFDVSTGELWVGDVGQDKYEEINIVTQGGNYGWAYREGAHAGPRTGPPVGFTSVDPLYEYTHGSGSLQGNSITGGLVYRGTRITSLTNAYLFADYISGNIWSLHRNPGGAAPTVQRITGEGGIVAFGTDPANGDVLLADIDGGRILRLIQNDVADAFPQTLGATGLFADLTDLSPNAGVVPYAPNVPFWSDYAIKRRWFTVPDETARMTWSRDGLWTFPTGTIWVKHFDFELTRGDPATKKHLETRILVKTDTGSYGVSYRWNDAQTDATLVPDEGVSFPLTVVENGIPRQQTWQIPSRASCLTCHTPQAGHALSFNTRQLNRGETINGFTANQLDWLSAAGYLNNTPAPSGTLPRHVRADETSFPLEARARSYLAVNCAYCHQAGGTATPAAWDGRHELTLAQTGLLHGNAVSNGGDPLNKLIVPGDTTHSVVLNRVGAMNGFTRMPPLGSSEIDQTSVALLTDWIVVLANREDYAAWRLTRFGSDSSPAGDPSADPDGDGRTNDAEFKGGTDPLEGGNFLQPTLTPDATDPATFSLHFTLPANRSFQVETSNDLIEWTVWNVPGNQGLPTAGGPITITGTTVAGETQGFFRVRLWEN